MTLSDVPLNLASSYPGVCYPVPSDVLSKAVNYRELQHVAVAASRRRHRHGKATAPQPPFEARHVPMSR
ncbi:hypothetical protein E4U54_003931 [Claviceps lovelessii]|nr:hypothetical protein E4U54_003931 [Claviceps lovelessii]